MKISLLMIPALIVSLHGVGQDAVQIKQATVAQASILGNIHLVFTPAPATENNPGNASQTFKGDDFIYGRVFFSKPLKEVLFLEKNDEGTIPVDVFVEDLSNHSSLYISLDLSEDEMTKNYFDFDILPDPAVTLRNSKEFETGRFSYFVSDAGLENKRPVFKFTVGDATGYIQVDFSGVNLQQVKDRDRQAYQNAHKVKAGEEKQ